MDVERFDALSRALAAHGSRRRALAAALSGALGLRGLAVPEDAGAAKSGKCKPKCGECEKCKKGDCDKKNGKKTCKKGKCKPKVAGTPCTASPGGTCQAGTCVDPNACSTPNCAFGGCGGPAGMSNLCVCVPRHPGGAAMCIRGTEGPFLPCPNGNECASDRVCVSNIPCGGGGPVCARPCV